MKWKILAYKSDLKALARKLRNNSTLSEKLLWNYLKSKRLNGFDFDRQRPIDNYIVDFFYKEMMLAIEIDGITHNEKMKDDQMRQIKMENLGIRFLRFTDDEVKQNPEGIANFIKEWIKTNSI